jgi:hypothetical protein
MPKNEKQKKLTANSLLFSEALPQTENFSSDDHSLFQLAQLKTQEINHKIWARNIYRYGILIFLFLQLALLTWLIKYSLETEIIFDIEIFLSTLLPSTLIQTYAILRIMVNSDFKDIKY